MATIEERTDGYTVRWRELETTRNEDGSVSRVWKSRRRQCPDMKTAKALKLEIEQRTAKGERWQPEYEKPRPTLDVIAVAYLKDRRRALGERTVEQYSNALELFLRFLHEREGDRPLYPDVLTKALLGEFYDWLLAGKGRVPPHDRPHQRVSSEPRKPQTARKNTEVARVMWAWAADSDEFADDVPRPRTIEYPDEEIDPTVAPTWAEMDACVEAARGWVRKLAIVLRFTGLRVQQVMALTWDDVDLEAGTLRIRGALGKSAQEKRGRIVPISPHLVAELAGWGKREGYVVPIVRRPTKADAGTERLARGRDMARAWRRAGVAEDRWRGQPDHAFRKGIVSGLKLLGADGEAVEYIVGHARPSVRGAYLDPDFLPNREAVARIPAIGASNADVRRLRAK
jgi:integrase